VIPVAQRQDARVPIYGEDIQGAAQVIAAQIKSSIGYPDEQLLSDDYGVFKTMTGGLFAIAAAINRLADVIEAQSS
jgi:hypothetical protein